jgi:hypothetical protein
MCVAVLAIDERFTNVQFDEETETEGDQPPTATSAARETR